jgi:hypothetical protein
VVAVDRSVSGESGFIIFLFYFLVSSCLLASLLGFVLLNPLLNPKYRAMSAACSEIV